MYQPLKRANSRQNAQTWYVWVQCISMCAFFASGIVQAQEVARNELNRTEPPIRRHFFEQLPAGLEFSSNFRLKEDARDLTVQPIDSRSMDVSRENLKVIFGDDALRLRRGALSILYASLTKDAYLKVQSSSSPQNAMDVGASPDLRGQDFNFLGTPVSSPVARLFYPNQDVQRVSAYDATFLTDKGKLIYHIGKVDLVINQLPDSFSLSSLGFRSSAAR